MSEENPVPGTHKRSSTLVQQVMDSLSRRIEQGEYSPGDKLPPESGLMLEQHVSRTVIREAISRLQALCSLLVEFKSSTRISSWCLS